MGSSSTSLRKRRFLRRADGAHHPPLSRRPADRALEICVAAFTPIHTGFEAELSPELFERHYSGWREGYAATIAGIPELGPETRVHVIEEDGEVVGFGFASVNAERGTGELGLNAVDPARQGKGLGSEVYAFLLADLKARGAASAEVGTGADAAHAPARAAYARAGFVRKIETVYYFREL